MDINELKTSNTLQSLEDKAINLFEEFMMVNDELLALTNSAIKKKKEDLISEFESYFTVNGFKVIKSNNNIVATLDNLTINLKDENPEIQDDEAMYLLEIPSKKIYSTIVIKANSETIEMLYWKNNLKGPDNSFIDSKTYRKQLERIDDEYLLEKTIKKIKENIDWYNKTIKEFDDVKYIYSPYKSYEEYNSFEDYFKGL